MDSSLLKVSIRRNDMEGAYFKYLEGCDLKCSEGWDGYSSKEEGCNV